MPFQYFETYFERPHAESLHHILPKDARDLSNKVEDKALILFFLEDLQGISLLEVPIFS